MFFHIIGVEADIFKANKELAERNRMLFKKHNVKTIDVMGAIGSGKTALIETMSHLLKKRGIRVGAITGDVAGDDDAKRLESIGVPVENINTGKECHLDAHLIHHAIEHFDLDAIDVLFIENVGNLVCPADFQLGTDIRCVVVSVTEGDDMVRKHPVIFGTSDVAVVNKIDLADAMGVDLKRIEEDFRKIKPNGILIETSVKTGEGIEKLMDAMGL
ncbi:MAG: hydrogenase nickel incorporation protein HypB [Candidatus Diapherotrites archaeon]|nr:hydrogenase nickel incorporation protein HypB [Candidatus Diapherotrites archaeon]